jgi:hypothetical protein
MKNRSIVDGLALELFEAGPALQELSRDIRTDLVEPLEDLRKVHF